MNKILVLNFKSRTHREAQDCSSYLACPGSRDSVLAAKHWDFTGGKESCSLWHKAIWTLSVLFKNSYSISYWNEWIAQVTESKALTFNTARYCKSHGSPESYNTLILAHQNLSPAPTTEVHTCKSSSQSRINGTTVLHSRPTATTTHQE